MPTQKSRYTLPEAVGDPKTWHFTWELRDDVKFETTCDFCGQGEQRLTYEVARDDERMWICQRCVGRYPIAGFVDGFRLDVASVRAQIHGLTARLKQQTCYDVIKTVQAQADGTALEEALLYFNRNLQLSPQYAAVLFAAMNALALPVSARIFDVQTRSVAHQDEFGALDEGGKLAVWPALTPTQRRRMASLGHVPAGIAIRKAPDRTRRAGR